MLSFLLSNASQSPALPVQPTSLFCQSASPRTSRFSPPAFPSLLFITTTPRLSTHCPSRTGQSHSRRLDLRRTTRITYNQRKRPRSALALLPTGTTEAIGRALLVNAPLYIAANQSSQRLLTASGLRHALALGLLLWTTVTWRGYTLCFLFLILGSAVTRVGRARKEALGIAEARGGARGPENLWGAAGVAAILATAAFLARGVGNVQWETRLVVGYVGALAAKFSDTAGSEIGKAYGTETYRLGTWEQVSAGTEGGVSVEGSLASVAGSALAGAVAWCVGLITGIGEFGIVSVAGVIASTAESVVGGRFQEKYGLSNETVNVLNTAIGAVVAIGLHVATGRLG